jgi:hypothetical protein
MSRISNLSNLRIPHFNSWKTTWYEKDKNYSFLFFRDFQLYQYLKGLFYRLKMLTDDFCFDNLTNHHFFIKVNVYLYKFQIKKYFLSFFMDQYLLYNFLLKKRKYRFSFKYSFNLFSFFYFLNFLKKDMLISYPFFTHYFFYNFLKHNKHVWRRRRVLNFIPINRINNRRKFHINPIKLKLKKNILFFFNYYRKKDKNIYFIKKYFIYIMLKNILSFVFNLNYNYFFISYFSFFINKIKLLQTLLAHFISVNKQKNELTSFYYLKENYKRELNRDIFDERTYYDFFFYFFLYSLILNVEKSIYLFTGNQCIFSPTFYYYKKFPSFISAKLINDYVLLELEKGNNLFRVFKMLQMYQLREKAKLKQELRVTFNKELFFSYFTRNQYQLKKKIKMSNGVANRVWSRNVLSSLKLNKKLFFSYFLEIRQLFEELYYNEVLAKKYPLIGIRIECNGPPKRGRQARLVAYHQIVKNYKLFGKMPNKSILADIDYYQSFARTKQGSIGIKVWVFFYSKTYDSNYKLISII